MDRLKFMCNASNYLDHNGSLIYLPDLHDGHFILSVRESFNEDELITVWSLSFMLEI